MKRAHILLLSLSGLCASCAGLQLPGTGGGALEPSPPDVSVAGVTVAEMPTSNALAAYLCGRYVPSPMNRVVCRAFGPEVSADDMRFAFDLEVDVANPNDIPMPVVQALVAFTAYPERTDAQNLGALCVSFCEDPANCAQDAADACQSDDPEIRDLESFAGAAANFLQRAATGQAGLEDLRVKTVDPGGSARVVVRLQLQPIQILELLREAGGSIMDEIRNGQTPTFAIQYSVEGSAWVSIQNLGRIAVDFGPVAGEWQMADAAN